MVKVKSMPGKQPTIDLVRKPDIAGHMMAEWFFEPFASSSVKIISLKHMRGLAELVYNCIIDIDDSIDLGKGDIKELESNYLSKIDILSKKCGLSNSYRNEVNNLYSCWINSEKKLYIIDLFSNNSSLEIHELYKDKVCFLKLIPLAFGEYYRDNKITKKICDAYDYAAIANAYIDDMTDYEEDYLLGVTTNIHVLLEKAITEKKRKYQLKTYLKESIKYNEKASLLFLAVNAISFHGYCEHQIDAAEKLLNMLDINTTKYVIKYSRLLFKST